MATLAQLFSALNTLLASAGIASVNQATLDTISNTIEAKLSAQADLDRVLPKLQNYGSVQVTTEGLGWHVSKITQEVIQNTPPTGYKFRCFFEGVLQ